MSDPQLGWVQVLVVTQLGLGWPCSARVLTRLTCWADAWVLAVVAGTPATSAHLPSFTFLQDGLWGPHQATGKGFPANEAERGLAASAVTCLSGSTCQPRGQWGPAS